MSVGQDVEDSTAFQENIEMVSQTETIFQFCDDKHRDKVYQLLDVCRLKIAEEMGLFFGVEVENLLIENKLMGSEQIDHVDSERSLVIAKIDTSGDVAHQCFLSMDLKNAIKIGCRLLLFADSKSKEIVSAEKFSEDVEDAYGEVMSLITLVLTEVFEREYEKSFNFAKTGFHLFKYGGSDQSFSDLIKTGQEYHVTSMRLTIEETDSEIFHLILPVEIFQLEDLMSGRSALANDTTDDSFEDSKIDSSGGGERGSHSQLNADSGINDTIENDFVLLIGDDQTEIAKLQKVLESKQFGVRVLSFKDKVDDFIAENIRAVYLVACEVDEQLLGVAIKVCGVSTLPVIAAAPGWTKGKVLKAVKYGIKDILLTPADDVDIEKNVDSNIKGKRN